MTTKDEQLKHFREALDRKERAADRRQVESVIG
jgi:hypothetical protein